MQRTTCIPVLAAVLAFGCYPLHSHGRILIHAGRLIDGYSEAPSAERTLVIDGERIVGVEPGFLSPGEGDSVIDLRAGTVLPGLIDMHVHLAEQLSPNRELERYKLNPGDYALRAAHFARITLLAGFTTVRNLGDRGGSTFALKKAIREGYAVGPRVFTAGAGIGTTGGHADQTNGAARELMGDPGPAEGVINGPDEACKAVRQRYKEGADLIKITATGGVLSQAVSGMVPQFTHDELRAIVETAQDYGMKVAAHAHGAEGMKRAILAGVDSIEHGTYMTQEVIELMKQHGTYYVPTVSAGRFVAAKAEVDGYFTPIVRPKAAAIGPLIQATLGRAYASGVKIAFGTDQGVAPHGENALELQYMAQAGMPPMVIIRSATQEAARLLGQEKELGTLEAGKYADVIAVEGNPLEDLSLMMYVTFVMKSGRVYKGPTGE